MRPLYYARVASFMNRTKEMTTAQAEDVIEEQARIFEDLKPYLLEVWNRTWSAAMGNMFFLKKPASPCHESDRDPAGARSLMQSMPFWEAGKISSGCVLVFFINGAVIRRQMGFFVQNQKVEYRHGDD